MLHIDWELLFRYCGDECTGEERARFERWLEADPRHRALFEAIVRGAARSLDAPPSRADAASVPPLRLPRRRPWRSEIGVPRLAWRVIAAALVIAAGTTVVVRGGLLGRRDRHRADDEAMRTVATRPGERAQLRLPDGSRITLAPASTIRYSAAPNAGAREVMLHGEALFAVVHDASRPLVVRAGDIVVRDLGTTFDVRAYPGDREARVVVAEGRVALRARGARAGIGERAVRAGERAEIDRRGVIGVERADPSQYTEWTVGRLRFDQTPLVDVVAELRRWYGTPVELGDPALGRRDFTGSFDDGESLDDAMAVIAAAVGARTERRGSAVLLRARAPAR